MDPRAFATLKQLLLRIPAIGGAIGTGHRDGLWWVKFRIDLQHPLAWRVVQELAWVLNYLSLRERLPTVFTPVSPAPYLNGGPDDYLSWIVEAKDASFRPGTCAKWLEGRLPQPVEDEAAWQSEQD
ncbi:MAG: hypothetical protein AAFU38_08010 [Bacteroidota bacterium]